MGYENWTQAVEGWIEEKQLYYYGYPSTAVVGHYTQVGSKMMPHPTSMVPLSDDLAFDCSRRLWCSHLPTAWSIHGSMASLRLQLHHWVHASMDRSIERDKETKINGNRPISF